ncbi:MAG TPA: hypothetical protein PK098_00015 [Phycisphaerales bacterium]|nr:hypothetical protein [Phycisphaerales bacterium]
MASRSSTEAGHLAQAVHRLRLLQEELADRPCEERHQRLREELETTLAHVAAPQRRAFVDALLARFPAWEASPEPRTVAADRSVTDGVKAPPLDADQLVDRLIEAMKRMDESRRARIRERLRAAELIEPREDSATTSSGTFNSAPLSAIRRDLHLKSDARIDTTQLVTLLSKLLAFAEKLDRVAGQTRAEIMGGSSAHAGAELRAACARYLADGPGASKVELVDRIEQSRRLIAALMTVQSRITPVAQQIVDRLAPAKIEGIVARETKGGIGSLLHGKESQFWRKYREVAASLTAEDVERELHREIMKYLEEYAPARAITAEDSSETSA